MIESTFTEERPRSWKSEREPRFLILAYLPPPAGLLGELLQPGEPRTLIIVAFRVWVVLLRQFQNTYLFPFRASRAWVSTDFHLAITLCFCTRFCGTHEEWV
jgi:hypothetical protein